MAVGADRDQGSGDEAGAASDEALARQVQGGDRDALERLVRRYLRPVHAVAASFLPDTQEVEDAAQETFLRAIGAIGSYDPDRPFAPWLSQIARNVARNRVASRSRWHWKELTGRMVSSLPSPDVAAERSEIREQVAAAMARLPDQRRTAFRLVDVEGMNADEAARIMGLATGTVRSHVHHARRALRAALVETAGEDEIASPAREAMSHIRGSEND